MPKPVEPPNPAIATLSLEPIGFVRSPYTDRASAPRQPYVSSDARGTIELLPGRGFEHALDDLDEWEFIWVIFWFHLNKGWRPKVLPPRSTVRRGLFATRTPHRPNPLGLSVMRLESVKGLTLHVRGLDLIDGTPVLDIKPYVPWADSIPNAGSGWFDPRDGEEGVSDATSEARPADPIASHEVTFDAHAREQLDWLATHDIDLETPLRRALALGPHPHPYRRIKPDGDGQFVVAHKEWRARFRIIADRTLEVFDVFSGYRPAALASDEAGLDVHRAFVARWSSSDAAR
jgi:tRNA-Thr(GGU) m(6)t(6)A37 methyltransferase TsaA